MHSAPAVPVSGVFSCKRCVDLVLPHDRFHQSQKWTVDAPARSAKRILVGMIIWPPLRMVSVVEDVRDDREPPYLIQIATTVIQC